MLGADGVRWIDRESWIKFEDRYVRYPFQNHLSSLPEQAMIDCLAGLDRVADDRPNRAFSNFEEWVLAKFGAGRREALHGPVQPQGLVDSVPEMGLLLDRRARVGRRLAEGDRVDGLQKLTDWGPNAKFGYPKHGGTLGLWKAVLPYLGDRVRYKKRAACIDENRHEVVFTDGTKRSYDRLLTTLPLEAFVARLAHAPDRVTKAAKTLLFNRLFSVGIGLSRPCPSDKNWIYFPNLETPFYRMTYLSNYSPDIVPGSDTSRYFACSPRRRTRRSSLCPKGDFGEAVVKGLIDEGILEESDRSASRRSS